MLSPGELAQYEQSLTRLYRHLTATAPTPEQQEKLEQIRLAPDRGRPQSSCFICLVNRSGTTYLGELMSRTKKLGYPQEYFNPQPDHAVERLSRRLGTSNFHDYVEKLVRRRQTGNGVFATKASFLQLAYLYRTGRFHDVFARPQFILVRREDALMQAISWYIAEQTQAWASFQPDRGEPEFDQSAILAKLQHIVLEYARFEYLFNILGVGPLIITYEALSADPSGAINRIWQHLGGDRSIAVSVEETRHQIQRTARNAEWATRIRQAMSQWSAR
jgi:LPS sulfotransferase NodH